jgi:hypothetical protein
MNTALTINPLNSPPCTPSSPLEALPRNSQLFTTMTRTSILAAIGLLLLLPILGAAAPQAFSDSTVKRQSDCECGKSLHLRTKTKSPPVRVKFLTSDGKHAAEPSFFTTQKIDSTYVVQEIVQGTTGGPTKAGLIPYGWDPDDSKKDTLRRITRRIKFETVKKNHKSNPSPFILSLKGGWMA